MKVLFERGIVDMKDYDRIEYHKFNSMFKTEFCVFVKKGIGWIDKLIVTFDKEEYAKKFIEDFLNDWLNEELCFNVNKWVEENVA